MDRCAIADWASGNEQSTITLLIHGSPATAAHISGEEDMSPENRNAARPLSTRYATEGTVCFTGYAVMPRIPKPRRAKGGNGSQCKTGCSALGTTAKSGQSIQLNRCLLRVSITDWLAETMT